MSVPITSWLEGGLKGRVDDLLGEKAVRARGLFRPEAIAAIRGGAWNPAETRRRRTGEKLWALMMLEAWIRTFVDRRGRP